MSHVLAVAVVSLAVLLSTPGAAAAEPATEPTPIAVKGTRLTFDPKTSTEGAGGFPWGLGSVFVTLRGHEGGKCVFDYKWEVEGAGNYVVHRVAVSLDAGPVVIDADQRGEGEHHWSGGVFTSFTAAQSRLLYSMSFGWFEEPLEGTEESVSHRPHRPGDKDKPLAKGDKVTVRVLLFIGSPVGDFVNIAGEEWQRQSVRVTIGEGGQWKWVEQVVGGMTLYEIRQVKVPARHAGPARKWLPGYTDETTITAELQAVAVERK